MSTTPSIHRSPTTPADAWRFERKFLVAAMRPAGIEDVIRRHPACFSEIHHQRFVNNCYLDSIDLRAYRDAVIGNRDRVKVRVRWYGELFGPIERPVLEFKVKAGLVGCKHSAPLPPCELDARSRRRPFEALLEEAELSDWMREAVAGVRPQLLNRYSRRYFLSADKRFRLTLDTELSFRTAGLAHAGALDGHLDREHTVVELKYARGDDDDAERIATRFPFRVTKSSKYVEGIERVVLR